jgi:hypothetical protein
MVEVLVDDLDRRWWRDYGEKLATRFEEEQIHICALAAEVL